MKIPVRAILSLGALCAALTPAEGQVARTHTVKQVLVRGADVASAQGVTVTLRDGSVTHTLQRGETIADGTRVDVPDGVVAVIVSTGEKSTVTLEPGSGVTFVSTGQGELVRANHGKALFEVVHNSLDFFRVQYGAQITAGVSGTSFSIDGAKDSVGFACTTDEVTLTRNGHILVGAAREAISLADVISAKGTNSVTYPIGQPYLAKFATFAQAESFYASAVAAAKQLGDNDAIVAALTNLGHTQTLAGKYAAAVETLDAALSLAQQSNSKEQIARVSLNVAVVQEERNQYADATASATQALNLYRDLGDVDAQAHASTTLASILNRQGQYTVALQSLQSVLQTYQHLGDVHGAAQASYAIGQTFWRELQPDSAEQPFEAAKDGYERTGDLDGEASALIGLGLVHSGQGDGDAAMDAFNEALTIYERLGDPKGEATAFLNMGMVERDRVPKKKSNQNATQLAPALASFQRALGIYQSLGDQLGQAHALVAVGTIHERQNQLADALRFYQQAVAIFEKIDAQGTDAAKARENVQRVRAKMASR